MFIIKNRQIVGDLDASLPVILNQSFKGEL
jgi:hypothetical protein